MEAAAWEAKQQQLLAEAVEKERAEAAARRREAELAAERRHSAEVRARQKAEAAAEARQAAQALARQAAEQAAEAEHLEAVAAAAELEARRVAKERQQHQQQQHQQQQQQQQQQAPPRAWSCRECTFGNGPLALACGACATERPPNHEAAELPPSPVVTARLNTDVASLIHAFEATVLSGDWTCLVCTFTDNNQDRGVCEMCSTPRGDEASSAARGSGHGVVENPDDDEFVAATLEPAPAAGEVACGCLGRCSYDRHTSPPAHFAPEDHPFCCSLCRLSMGTEHGGHCQRRPRTTAAAGPGTADDAAATRAPIAVVSSRGGVAVCRYFSSPSGCRNGSGCRWLHEAVPIGEGARPAAVDQLGEELSEEQWAPLPAPALAPALAPAPVDPVEQATSSTSTASTFVKAEAAPVVPTPTSELGTDAAPARAPVSALAPLEELKLVDLLAALGCSAGCGALLAAEDFDVDCVLSATAEDLRSDVGLDDADAGRLEAWAVSEKLKLHAQQSINPGQIVAVARATAVATEDAHDDQRPA